MNKKKVIVINALGILSSEIILHALYKYVSFCESQCLRSRADMIKMIIDSIVFVDL